MTVTQKERSSPALTDPDVDMLAVNTIRFLAADMVEAANSGHPGMPMGAAPMAWTLFSRHLKHDPDDPTWADRDRFVLSAGHGSALQYALLHMFGYDLPLLELQRFRQLGSSTPGHPEFGHTSGVEMTTGPLGQGLATAVGMAIAERMTAARYPELTDHRTYVIVGDGCLMEGISHEAASLAGHLRLGRLIVLFDDNGITIDGATSLACSDDHLARFASYGWHVATVSDGTNIEAIDEALAAAKSDPRPSFIAVRTVIGHGAPGVAGTSKAHGTPLGPKGVAGAKANADWEHPPFFVPRVVRAVCALTAESGRLSRHEWIEALHDLRSADPERATTWDRTQARTLPSGLEKIIRTTPTGGQQATRVTSQVVLRTLAEHLPELVGGSADLAGSTGTNTGSPPIAADDFSGSTINFGIREFAMAAVLNGLSLHGGFRPFGSTFLVFSDYLRPALRLSALMRQPVVYVLTHDSIAVGEDGPTHQPVEHIESLRLIPGVQVLRPADDHETIEAWIAALSRIDGPTVLVLSRQNVGSFTSAMGTAPNYLSSVGARVVAWSAEPTVELLATGAEVGIAIAAADVLARQGVSTRVVSIPWREQFVVNRSAFEPATHTVSVEAGVTSGWLGVVGADGVAIGMDQFGASGPGDQVMAHFGLTPEAIVRTVQSLVGQGQGEAGTPAGGVDGSTGDTSHA